MRRAIVVVAGVLAIVAGVWAWQSATQGRVENRFVEIASDGGSEGGPPSDPFTNVGDALAHFGERNWCHWKLHLPPKSLIPTDEESPEFGATVSPRKAHSRWHDYDIWKDGVVVLSVTLHQYPDGWGIAGFRGCDPSL